MSRKQIDTLWDRKTRNDINDNFEELYSLDKFFEKGGTIHMNSGPKGAYNSFVELKDNHPNGDDGFYVVNGDWYYWNGSEWINGGIYQSRGIVDKSITPKKTDFLITGKNLFNGDFTSEFTYFSNGFINKPSTTTPYAMLIEIDIGATYTITKFEGGNRFIVCLLEDYPNVDSLPVSSDAVHDGNRSGNKEHYTFTNSENAKYLFVLTNSNGGEPPNVQVEKGENSTEYEGFKIGFKNPLHELPLIRSKHNLFDGHYIDAQLFGNNFDNPVFVPVFNYSNYQGKIAIIPIEHNRTYYVKIYDPEKSNRFRIGLSHEQVQFQTKGDDLQTNEPVPPHYKTLDKRVISSNSLTEYTFSSEDYNYAVLHVDSSGNEPRMWIATSYPPEEYKSNLVIDPAYIEFPANIGEIEYPDQVSKGRFIKEMNRYAERIGMIDTNFVEPAGYPSTAEQTMTAYDMLLLGIQAVSYDRLARIWNKKSYIIRVDGPDNRNVTIDTTVTSELLENDYYIFGGKTGRIVSVEPSENLILIANAPNDRMFVGSIMGADSRAKRFTAMKQMYDYSKEILDGNTPNNPVIEADHGATCLLPVSHLSSYERYDIPIIFSKDMKTKRHPASVSKVMSAMVILDNIVNLNEKITIKVSDMKGGTGNVFNEGDIITIEDALYAMMLPSSNTATHAVSRYVGNKLLNIENAE